MRFLPSRRTASAAARVAAETGPVLVAVDGSSSGDHALEWAAVEASARGVPLRIVHVVDWPLIFDSYGVIYRCGCPGELEAGLERLHAAAVRARAVAATVTITRHAVLGTPVSAILGQARGASLIVVGSARNRGSRAPLAARLARRSPIPLAVIGPTDGSTAARDAGRVMLALDGPGPHTAAVAAAFRAAHRRGTDLTVVHGARPDQVQDHGGQTFRSLRRWHVRFPDVAVREGLMAAPFGAALGLAATGVALLVLTTPTSTEGRARTWPRSLDHTVTDLLGLRTPAAVLFVQAPPATVADLLTAPRPDSTISEPGARPASGPRP